MPGRSAYAHDAVVTLARGGDPAAPGGAVTLVLCGSWDHPPPCPLAPHHTCATAAEDGLRIRILFAANADHEARVRALIEEALTSGRLTGPDGRVSEWSLVTSGVGAVRPEEADHAARLIAV